MPFDKLCGVVEIFEINVSRSRPIISKKTCGDTKAPKYGRENSVERGNLFAYPLFQRNCGVDVK
jgi:hypothetical protein